MLFHVGYVSTETAPMSGRDLLGLLQEVRIANREQDITGVLVHRDDSFFQVLEGSEDAVRRVFAKIRRDSRHHRVKILFEGPIEKREFSDWRMGFLQLDGIDVSRLPGFSDILTSDAPPRKLFEELSRAERLLMLFRNMN